MTSTDASKAVRRRIVIATPVVLILAFAGWAISMPDDYNTRPSDIAHQVGYDRLGCVTKIKLFPRLADRWPRAWLHEIIACVRHDARASTKYQMVYAEFLSAADQRADIARNPPFRTYCMLDAAVVVDDGIGPGFGQMCAQRHGSLHPITPTRLPSRP